MKKILLLFLIALSLTAPAQNYQCLQPGVKPFYTNGNGYLRGMRIDSVRASGSDTIYYPYHTPRGKYIGGGPLDSTGSSWLGKRVVQHANGIVVFDNMWADSVIIYTQAHTGFTWTLFEDTTNISYNATVTATDTMTILGVVDSVKYITIEADTNWVMNASDPVNNFQIILSKNNGFVQVFDLYTFPYHVPANVNHGMVYYGMNMKSYDYYFDLITNSLACLCDNTLPFPVNATNTIFHLVPFHNATLKELYNYSLGEVLEYQTARGNLNYGYNTTTVDTVISKTTTLTSVSYTMSGCAGITIETGPPEVITYSSGCGGTTTLSYDTSLLMNMALMPEEWRINYFYHYFPKSTYASGSACPDTAYIIDVNNIDYTSASVVFEQEITDGQSFFGNTTSVYSVGFGLTNYNYTNWTGPITGTDTSMTYVDNGGITCGNYTSTRLSVNNINALANGINIYPNPTSTQLTITSTQPITNIIITNLLGQTVTSQTNNTEKIRVDVSLLPAGIYFVKINGSEVMKFVKE